jgi:hypothetical protein
VLRWQLSKLSPQNSAHLAEQSNEDISFSANEQRSSQPAECAFRFKASNQLRQKSAFACAIVGKLRTMEINKSSIYNQVNRASLGLSTLISEMTISVADWEFKVSFECPILCENELLKRCWWWRSKNRNLPPAFALAHDSYRNILLSLETDAVPAPQFPSWPETPRKSAN